MNPEIANDLLVGEKVKGLFFLSIQNDFYGVLEIYTHLVRLKIVTGFLRESFLGHLVFRLEGKDLLDR